MLNLRTNDYKGKFFTKTEEVKEPEDNNIQTLHKSRFTKIC